LSGYSLVEISLVKVMREVDIKSCKLGSKQNDEHYYCNTRSKSFRQIKKK